MKIYAACYTDCYHESACAAFSLHKTYEGAQKAINDSKSLSQQIQENQFKWCKENGFGCNTWSEESGDGFERWMITEMELKE